MGAATDTAIEIAENEPAAQGPLVFISHDSRDAAIADAFAKLVKGVSAGMIHTFHSSAKTPGGGIEYGHEWYERLMDRLAATTDVVCLFTERSIGRPWILFEAGVAKGKLDTPVVGLAVDVPLSQITTGPFSQFQNMEARADDLVALLNQFALRIPGMTLDPDVVSTQVAVFLESVESLREDLRADEPESPVDEVATSLARLTEELKSLPFRVAERVSEPDDSQRRGERSRLPHGLLHDLMSIAEDAPNPRAALLIAASLVRDDFPWMHQLAMDVYSSVRIGAFGRARMDLQTLQDASEYTRRFRLFGRGRQTAGRDLEMLVFEWPMMFDELARRVIARESSRRKKTPAEAPRGEVLPDLGP